MRHHSGVNKLDELLPEIEFSFTENIKKNVVGAMLERLAPHRVPGLTRIYQGWTKHWLLNEVFRRVEPQGRTMGLFFEDEI